MQGDAHERALVSRDQLRDARVRAPIGASRPTLRSPCRQKATPFPVLEARHLEEPLDRVVRLRTDIWELGAWFVPGGQEISAKCAKIPHAAHSTRTATARLVPVSNG